MKGKGFGLLFIACYQSLVVTENTPYKPPHIIFILADDYGFNDIGYHDSEINTPVLDKLAEDGVKLENYYVQPTCTPTRSQLLSGRYQIHTGLQHGVISKCLQDGLPLDHPTIADKLKETGYDTHMVGKWHLGQSSIAYTPTRRGFDTFFGYLGGFEDYYSHKSGGRYDFFENGQKYYAARGQYSTFAFTQRAQSIIEGHNASKPMFLYLAYQSVHGPLQVPEAYKVPYASIQDKDRKTYAGMVAAMDESIGKLMETLKTSDLWDNTVIIFSTDNGGELKNGARNYPLKGSKGSYYEGGIRGVGFVTGPLVSGVAGTVNKQLIHVSDWFPTLLTLAGGSVEEEEIDGYDAWNSIIHNITSSRNEILLNIDPFPPNKRQTESSIFDTSHKAALRMGDFKIITGFYGESDPHSFELYNIAEDPLEMNKLDSETYSHIVHGMLQRLAYWNKGAVPVRSRVIKGTCFPWLKR